MDASKLAAAINEVDKLNGNDYIVANKLTKVFNETVAVNKLDLRVQRGEIFGLIGPDGAGKTTIIRMLAGIMDPTSGNASVGAFDTVRNSEAIKQIIGYMAQQFNLYGDMTVMENLSFFADIFQVKEPERKMRIQESLHFSGLAEFKTRFAANLSGGMKKKLALACSLIHRPEVIFLDEPTTGVDPISRREFWDIISNLHLQGVTILVSTPYMDEAERCNRIGLLYQGQLIDCDTPGRIKEQIRGELIEFEPFLTGVGGMKSLRLAQQIVSQMPGILEIQTYGALLQVFVDSISRRQEQILKALQAQNIQANNIRHPHPRLEQAFISRIQRFQQQAA